MVANIRDPTVANLHVDILLLYSVRWSIQNQVHSPTGINFTNQNPASHKTNQGGDQKAMNLTKLFEMQKALEERIVKEKGLDGQDLLPQKILALQVELGELANEWRGFKFWSNNQSPRPMSTVANVNQHPMLMEYVDCLHFILSIGLDSFYDLSFMYRHVAHEGPKRSGSVLLQFNKLFEAIVNFAKNDTREWFKEIFGLFFGLGNMLGFTWERIEAAYLSKHQINLERQVNGY